MLSKLKKLLFVCTVIFGGVMLVLNRLMSKEADERSAANGRLQTNYNIALSWSRAFNNRENVVSWFLDRGYRTVGIYGAGELGHMLYKSVKGSAVEVRYIINKNDGSGISIGYGEPVSQVPEILEIKDLADREPADVIVVTPVFAFDAIKNDLAPVFHNDIISIEDMTV